MDLKTIKRNLTTSILLCILCLLLCIMSLFFRWIEIAIAMALVAIMQAYMICVWLNRKKNCHSRKNKKSYNQ